MGGIYLSAWICVALLLIVDSSENIVVRKKQNSDADNVGKATDSKSIVKKLELYDEAFEWEGSGEEDRTINKTVNSVIASFRPNEQVRANDKLDVSTNGTTNSSTDQHLGAVKDSLNNGSNRMPIQKRVNAPRFRTRPHQQHRSRLSDFDYYDNLDYEDFADSRPRNPPVRYHRFNLPRGPYGYYPPFNPWNQMPNSAQYARAPPIDPYDFYNPYAIYYNPWGMYHQTPPGPGPVGFNKTTVNVQQSRYNTQDGQTTNDSQQPETNEIDPSHDYNSVPLITQHDPAIPTNDIHTTPRPDDYRDTNEPASDPYYQHTAPSPPTNCRTPNERPPDPYEQQAQEESHENPYDPYRDNEGDPYDSNPADNYDPYPEQHENYNHDDSEPRPEDQESYQNNDHNNRRPPVNRRPTGPDFMMQRPPYHGPTPMRRPYYGPHPQQQGYRPPESYNYHYGSRYGGFAGLAIVILVTLLIVFLIIASASLTSGRSLKILAAGKNGNIQQSNKTDAGDFEKQADYQHDICNFIETVCHVTRYARQSKYLPEIIRFYHELDFPPHNSELGFFIGHTSTLVLKNYVAFECPHLQPLC